jgi:hypothetical protein
MSNNNVLMHNAVAQVFKADSYVFRYITLTSNVDVQVSNAVAKSF